VSEPRFLIVHGRTQQGNSSPEWPTMEDPFAVRNRLDGDWYSWRLLSGNNRELGRGADVYPTELECLGAIAWVQNRAEGGASSIGVRASGQWWWQLEFGGVPVAVSGRVYQRQRECRYNFEQFLGALPVAQRPTSSGAQVIVLRRPEAQSWRVAAPAERLRRARMAP
jgi:hypothetical protein